MFKKVILSIIVTIFLIPTSLFANSDVGIIANNWFTNYSKKISSQNTPSQEVVFFRRFSERISHLKATKKITIPQKELLNELIKLSNERVFKLIKIKNQSLSTILLKTNPLVKDFENISQNPDHIFLKDWVWYAYYFKSHLAFPKGVEITNADLDYNWIDPDYSFVFLRDDNSLWFVKQYKIVRLIPDSLIYWIAWKYSFLQELKDDKKELDYKTDNSFIELRQKTIKLTKNKTKEARLQTIYRYILSNIQYTQDLNLNDYKIFSGIDTYKNKDWVCEWYAKLFTYMLSFANIHDSEVIRWFVIDAEDFPNVWHAWVRIWNNYYDPTFDDPEWLTETKTFKEYSYYKLPKDLFYTNRYIDSELPEELKTYNKEQIKDHIRKRLAPMVVKYKDFWYNLLVPYIFRLKHWIILDKQIVAQDLEKIMWSFEVKDFKFTKGGRTKIIQSLNYYSIRTIGDTESILDQINYDLTWYYLFKWDLGNWKYEYRLWYDIKYY